MPDLSVNGARLHYVDEGRGVPVILLHGITGDHSGWSTVIRGLRDGWRVIAPDNRGAGRSTQTGEPVTTEELAFDVLQLMSALDIEQAHVVGRSMGGAIAQQIAIAAPERVASLVLCASFARLDPLGDRILRNLREVLELTGDWRRFAQHAMPFYFAPQTFLRAPDTVAAVEAAIAASDRLFESYVRQSEACARHDIRPQAEGITCPALIVAGDRDMICSQHTVTELADLLPHSETVVIEHGSHFFVLEQPECFQRLLEDWLRRQVLGAADVGRVSPRR